MLLITQNENDSKLSNSPRNDKKKNRRKMAVLGGNRFSHFSHIVLLSLYQRRNFELSYEGCYTKVIKKNRIRPPALFFFVN